jgi:16S rRNA (guanine527-N7)-methyltransferase
VSYEAIIQAFPELTDKQRSLFYSLKSLYETWNAQINVISRKDTDNFYERHVLHSLAIAKIIAFKPGAKILDIGTGGGFPGIPLAILFPEAQFTLVDSIGKKIKVVNEIVKSLELRNVIGIHCRAEDIQDQFDFIVSRAVTAMPEFLKWTKGKFLSKNNGSLPNGVLYLKGGDLKEELQGLKGIKIYPIQTFFSTEFFETKAVVYVPGN